MNSIKTKIILAFSFILFALAVLVIIITVVEFGLINSYKKSNEIIVYEQLLKKDFPDLVRGYNFFKTGEYTQYDKKLKEMRGAVQKLDVMLSDSAVNNETKLAYRSFKNSFESIIGDVSNIKIQLESGADIDAVAIAFSELNTKFMYIGETINELLIAETVNISNTTQTIEEKQSTIVPLIIMIIIVIFFSLSVFSLFFAGSIANPIIALAETARDIVDEKPNAGVKKELLERKDEIGALSVSFNIMVKN